jgi:hypothetical protein
MLSFPLINGSNQAKRTELPLITRRLNGGRQELRSRLAWRAIDFPQRPREAPWN